MSKQILDSNISYAYTDKVLDPCPWGQRVYFYNCTREGGHGLWMNDNLQEAEGAPQYYTVTAQWTFNGLWAQRKWSETCGGTFVIRYCLSPLLYFPFMELSAGDEEEKERSQHMHDGNPPECGGIVGIFNNGTSQKDTETHS